MRFLAFVLKIPSAESALLPQRQQRHSLRTSIPAKERRVTWFTRWSVH